MSTSGHQRGHRGDEPCPSLTPRIKHHCCQTTVWFSERHHLDGCFYFHLLENLLGAQAISQGHLSTTFRGHCFTHAADRGWANNRLIRSLRRKIWRKRCPQRLHKALTDSWESRHTGSEGTAEGRERTLGSLGRPEALTSGLTLRLCHTFLFLHISHVFL